MNVISLSVSDFRNFSRLQADFIPGINVFHGHNGAGKTNLLEAVFVLCLGRSHRGAADAVFAKQGEDVYRISGVVEQEGMTSEVTIACQRGGRKKITIDKLPVRTAELYERHSIVSIGPEDSEILSGAPSVRRNFLNMYLAQSSHRYLENLIQYQKTLAQKNACLKSNGDPAPFNQLLIDIGTPIIIARRSFLGDLQPSAKQYYSEISHGGKLNLIYQPAVALYTEETDDQEIRRAFEQALRQNEERETVLKTALIGPHRDDISITIDDYPARTHGSQGEWRTAAIALKLAVYHLLKRRRRTTPVLLLDEVFAELDDQRAKGLIQALGELGQLFLTTATEPPESLREGCRNFHIHQGTIRDIR